MPLSVPTNEATTAGTSRSQPRWRPRDVLKLGIEGRCLGYALSLHRECHNPIAYHNMQEVNCVLDAMAKQQPDPELLRSNLWSLAQYGLCSRHRGTQRNGMVNEWTSRMKAAFPVEVARAQERRSATQSRPATAAVTPAGQVEALRAELDSLRAQLEALRAQQAGPASSITPPRPGVAHSPAARSLVAPSDALPTPNITSSSAARSTVSTAPRTATASATGTTRPAAAAAPLRPAEPRTDTVSSSSAAPSPSAVPSPSATPSSSAAALPNASQVSPRALRRRCTRLHARRLPFAEECPVCQEGGLLSELDASEVVWCRSTCGRSVHKTCFEEWRAQCVVDDRRLTCAVCRSDWDEHAECDSCDVVHARRRPIEGDCAICRDGLVEDGSTAAGEGGLVWCKSSCGQSVHRQCFDGWARQCVANGRAATCVSCRALWREGCEC